MGICKQKEYRKMIFSDKDWRYDELDVEQQKMEV